jgi:hypothetical protein
MIRPQPRPVCPTLSRLGDDLTVIDRIESVLRVAAADRPRHRNAPAMRRLADWIASLR